MKDNLAGRKLGLHVDHGRVGMVVFNARFYSVDKCGYYPWAANSAPALGGFGFLLEELSRWSHGKTLEQTRLSTNQESLPVYLLSLARQGNFWVVVLWNEVPSSDGAVASVSRNSRVGQPQIHDNQIVAGSIPGYATYFLCMADHDLVATLRHGDRVAGLSGFKAYLSTFQEIATSIADVTYEESDRGQFTVRGYRDADGEVLNLHSRFQLRLRRSGTQREEIISKHAQIRKVIRVKEIDPADRADRSIYQRGLDWIGLTRRPVAQKLRVKQEIDVELTEEEVAAVIDGVEDSLEREKNDVGFILRSGDRPIWLSGSILGHDLNLDVLPEDGVFDASGLAELASRRRTAILLAAGP